MCGIWRAIGGSRSSDSRGGGGGGAAVAAAQGSGGAPVGVGVGEPQAVRVAGGAGLCRQRPAAGGRAARLQLRLR